MKHLLDFCSIARSRDEMQVYLGISNRGHLRTAYLKPTEKVRVKEVDGIVQLIPVKENIDCTIGLRGILADYDDMSVDKFLERMRADKELDL